jgi:hypothetical protein
MADESTATAQCHGGPLDGQRITVRSRGGVLAVDKQAGRAWMYKQQPDGSYAVCTEHDDSLNYPAGAETGERVLDHDRAWTAGETSALPIIAVDSGA